ncbi:GH25 family lysozyme [Arthrobacter yangruifuii]|uniref:GH25 family lysozyme n=1 Tax=Arthrobacter yangruifuii TaxID=2606616 RepID=UPI001FF0652F|nr:GH25 family lysozyme [Arthrobacter yangruifuii]
MAEQLSETAADAPGLEADIKDEAGLLGARMGQGMERLLATGDPQVPTPEEKQQKLDAEAGQLETPLDTPDTTADEAPAATSAGFLATPAFAATAANTWMPAGIQGLDVSSHQENVDWAAAWRQGARFAYTKATEGTYYKNPYYKQQYNGSANTGMVRGAYHFAIPAVGSGAQEANYFVDNGGGWSADGRTLPPLLDIEYNPYPQLGNTCYNLSATQMITWIRDFSNTVQARTGRVPMIYTTTDWWRTCTGNTNAFSNHPLHLASYGQAAGALPNGWAAYNVWQYSSTGPFVGDSNVFKGSTADLDRFVRSSSSAGSSSPAATAISRVAAANPVLGKSTSSVNCGLKDGGCYQNFEGGAVLWSAATGAYPSRNGSIRQAYQASGFENGVLGYPRSAEVCGIKNNGCYQDFQGGSILWSSATGARVSPNGAIRTAYQKQGFESGSLGYPTSGQVCGIKDNGCYQNFQGGAILWSAATGAQVSANRSIRTAYQAAGFENGVLGYPRGPEVCGIKNNGCYQDFQGGAILWSSATGAQVSPNGAIRTAYQKQGFESGSLGYPTSGQVCGIKDNGCYQNYQGGAILWSPATGAQPSPSGAIRTAYQKHGFENGGLGYPTGAEVCGIKNNGCYQDFQGGAILWSSATGAQVSPNGPVRTAYQKQGFESGTLGYPTGGQVCGIRDNGCYQNYQGGAILWSPATGAQPSPNGAIRTAYQKQGFENGGLGYPTSGEVCGIKDNGCYQNYQGGAITWTKSVGAHPTAGEIRRKWQSTGFEKGVLGYPTADESCKAGKCTQPFQGGRIDWTKAGGAVVTRK